MESKETDKMLKEYFSTNKQEIQDNGFTRRVIQKLPEQTDHSWIVWLCFSIGLTLSFLLGLSSGALQSALVQLQNIPIYYLVGAIFCFPILSTIGFYFRRNFDY